MQESGEDDLMLPSQIENDGGMAEKRRPEVGEGDSEVIESIEKQRDNQAKELQEEATEDKEVNDVCVPLRLYGSGVRIYQCMKRPETVAHDICIWEKRRVIDQEVDIHPDAPMGENIFIPDEAKYVMVGERVVVEPPGSVLLFCHLVDPYTPQERYEPYIGFYYSYKNVNPGAILWSMLEYFNDAVAAGLVEPYEVVRPENPPKFREVYGMLTRAANAEMAEVVAKKPKRRDLRNNFGRGRTNPSRWRSRMVWDEKRTASGY